MGLIAQDSRTALLVRTFNEEPVGPANTRTTKAKGGKYTRDNFFSASIRNCCAWFRNLSD